MLKRLLVCIAALLVLAVAFGSVLDLSAVTAKTLDNGLQVIVKRDPGWGLVGAGVFIRCGSVNDPPGKSGLAHLTEHLLFEAQSPEAQGLGLAVENLGGRVNAQTLRDFTAVTLLVASPHFEEALGLAARHIKAPAFGAKAVAAEKKVVIREIADRSSDPASVAEQTLWHTAFEKHPYRWSIGGDRASVQSITPEDLRAHYAAYYVPNNMALVVVGDVQPEEVFATAKKYFGDMKRRAVPWKDPAREPPPDSVRTEVLHKNIRGTVVAMGFQAPSVADHRGVCAMDLLYTLLGEGEESWLAGTLVQEKHLALGATCDFLTQRYRGLFIISAICVPSRELPLRQAILDKLKELASKPLSKKELDIIKSRLYTSFAFTNETFLDQVGSIGFYAMIDTYRFAFDYTGVVQSITPEEVQDAALKWLTPDRHTVVLVRPTRTQGQTEACTPWPFG